MKGLFITFEGTEGCGKSTQAGLLAERLHALGHRVCELREPGSTPIGEEIRHTLKHSKDNAAMTAETELLLMSETASREQREHLEDIRYSGQMLLDMINDILRTNGTEAFVLPGRALSFKTRGTFLFLLEDLPFCGQRTCQERIRGTEYRHAPCAGGRRKMHYPAVVGDTERRVLQQEQKF